MGYTSEHDGLYYETVECGSCGAQVSNQGDGTVYDEHLDMYFCGKRCQKAKHQELNESEVTDDTTAAN
jgi:transcription elongation factor Elf1